MISRCRNRSAAPTSRAYRPPPKTGSDWMTGRRATSTDRTRLTFGPLRRQSTLVASPAQSNTARAITSAGQPAGEESGKRSPPRRRLSVPVTIGVPSAGGNRPGKRFAFLEADVEGEAERHLAAGPRTGNGANMPSASKRQGFRTQRLRYLRPIVGAPPEVAARLRQSRWACFSGREVSPVPAADMVTG